MSTAAPTPCESVAAIRVLTNAELFLDIVSWSGGWPARVVLRWREIKKERRVWAMQTCDFMWGLIWKYDWRTLELTKRIHDRQFYVNNVAPAIEAGDPDALRLALEFSKPAYDQLRHQYWVLAIEHFPGHVEVLEELDTFEPLDETDLRSMAVWRNPVRADHKILDRSTEWGESLEKVDSVVLIEWLLDNIGPMCFPPTLLKAAVLRGNLELVQLLATVVNQELERAIFYNVYCLTQDNSEKKEVDYMDILVFLLEDRKESHTRELERACFDAGDHKTLALIQRTRGLRYLANVDIDSAASKGHLETIRLLATTTRVTCTTDAMDGAARNGHLRVVEYLHHTSAVGCTRAAMDNAAANGHLKVIQFLHGKRQEGCTTRAMDVAAARGFFDVVKFLDENRQERCTIRGLDDVAKACYRYAAEYLYANRHEGYVVPVYPRLKRAEKERVASVRSILLHLLKSCGKLHANDLGNDSPKFYEKHAKRLEYDALRFQDLEVLTIILENRGLHYLQDVNIDGIAGDGNLELIRFLVQHVSVSCTVSAMDAAAAKGHLDVVKYLHETRDEGCTTAAMDMAASGNHWEVVAFLDENRSEGCSSVLLNAAVRSGRLDLVERYSKRFPRVSLGAAAFVAGVYGHTTIQEFLRTAF